MLDGKRLVRMHSMAYQTTGILLSSGEMYMLHWNTIELVKLLQSEETELHPLCLPVIRFGPFLVEIILIS